MFVSKASRQDQSQSCFKVVLALLYKRTSKERRKGHPPTQNNLSVYTLHPPPSNHSSCFNSVSNGSGVPGFGPGWNRTEGPGLGLKPPINPNRFVMAGLLPRLDTNLWYFGWVEPGPQFHSTVPATFSPIKYLSCDRIVI